MSRQEQLDEIMHSIEYCLTAKQLREMLEGMDDDARVGFVCDYGDHGNTQQFLPVSDAIDGDTASLRTTAYSNSGVALIRDDREPQDEPYEPQDDSEIFPIVVLQSF